MDGMTTQTLAGEGEAEREAKFINSHVTSEQILGEGGIPAGECTITDTYYRSVHDGKVFRVREQDGAAYLMHKSMDLSKDATKDRIEFVRFACNRQDAGSCGVCMRRDWRQHGRLYPSAQEDTRTT